MTLVANERRNPGGVLAGAQDAALMTEMLGLKQLPWKTIQQHRRV